MSVFVHPTAIVDPGAELGAGVKVWHFCHLMAGCRIGAGSSLGQNVFVGEGVSVGERVKVQNNVSLYKGVELADEVFVGPSAVFTNVINPRAGIERKDAFQPTFVERGATIGANATILCGNRIGAYALIGAGTVVTKPVAPHALVVGNPARRIGWVSRAGHRLHFDGEGRAVCEETGEVYWTHPQPLPVREGEGPTPGPSLSGRGEEGPTPRRPSVSGSMTRPLPVREGEGPTPRRPAVSGSMNRALPVREEGIWIGYE